MIDDNGNPVQGYRYDLFEGGTLKVRSGDFSNGNTASVSGDAAAEVVYWLNKAGTTKS